MKNLLPKVTDYFAKSQVIQGFQPDVDTCTARVLT